MGRHLLPPGMKFGRWTVVSKSDRSIFYSCVCECGTVRDVRKNPLTSGRSQSCGCLSAEKAAERGRARTTHGLSDSKIWAAYKDMKRRCYDTKNPRFKYYGAKGVEVCERWLGKSGFLNFVSDMGLPKDQDTLERISVLGNYEPGNCKWESDLSVQGFNKRLSCDNTSGKTGVQQTPCGNWRAGISKNGTYYNLGTYALFEDAVAARRDGEIEHYGFYKEDTEP